jgi:hypothetical protein
MAWQPLSAERSGVSTSTVTALSSGAHSAIDERTLRHPRNDLATLRTRDAWRQIAVSRMLRTVHLDNRITNQRGDRASGALGNTVE